MNDGIGALYTEANWALPIHLEQLLRVVSSCAELNDSERRLLQARRCLRASGTTERKGRGYHERGDERSASAGKWQRREHYLLGRA